MEYLIRSQGPYRPFEISGSLRIGESDDAPLATLTAVAHTHQRWQKEYSGVIQIVTITQTLISTGQFEGPSFPGFVVAGAINPHYTSAYSDDDALERVQSLAEFLATELRLPRITFTFGGISSLLERVEPDQQKGDSDA